MKNLIVSFVALCLIILVIFFIMYPYQYSIEQTNHKQSDKIINIVTYIWKENRLYFPVEVMYANVVGVNIKNYDSTKCSEYEKAKRVLVKIKNKLN